MGNLIEDLDKYLSMIPDDIRQEPNQLFELLEKSLVELQSQQATIDKLEKQLETCRNTITSRH